MNFLKYLRNREKELNDAVGEADNVLKKTKTNKAIEGWHLAFNTKKNRYYYYLISDYKHETGYHKHYLSKEEERIAAAIVNRDYAKKVSNLAKKEARLVKQLLDLYDSDNAFNCHEKLHPARRTLIPPILLSDSEYAEEWLKKNRNEKNPHSFENEIFTEKGEQVRSKTEKIIADMLYNRYIPYKYEEAIYLKENRFFPDFTILNPRTREVYYWEHFGMADNPEYMFNVLKKLEVYAGNGIITGKNLITTFEMSNKSLSMKTIENIINEIFSE